MGWRAGNGGILCVIGAGLVSSFDWELPSCVWTDGPEEEREFMAAGLELDDLLFFLDSREFVSMASWLLGIASTTLAKTTTPMAIKSGSCKKIDPIRLDSVFRFAKAVKQTPILRP